MLAALSFSAVFVAREAPDSLSPTSARQPTSSVFRSDAPRDVDLGSRTNLAMDPSEQVSAHLYAVGTQNYFWMGLTAIHRKGPGIFEGTTHIQRVNTVGGLMPTTPGTAYGQVVKVPYTAEYIFYK